MCGIRYCERDMAGRPENGDQASWLTPTGNTDGTRDRERTMRMLRRIADVLGRPVEDFFKPIPEGDATVAEGDKDGRK